LSILPKDNKKGPQHKNNQNTVYGSYNVVSLNGPNKNKHRSSIMLYEWMFQNEDFFEGEECISEIDGAKDYEVDLNDEIDYPNDIDPFVVGGIIGGMISDEIDDKKEVKRDKISLKSEREIVEGRKNKKKYRPGSFEEYAHNVAIGKIKLDRKYD
jgi:hypothetical protein